MALNVDALLAAEEPWSVTIHGRTFTALPVSWPDFCRWERDRDIAREELAAVQTVRQRTAAGHRLEQAIRAVLRAAFPSRWRYAWHALTGRPGRWPDPVLLILRLPPAQRQQVLADFFDYLETWMERDPSPKPSDSSKPCSAAGRPSSDGGSRLALADA